MVRKSVKETFENCAADYDKLIEKVVPYYHKQHEIMLSLIPFSKTAKIKILDLGIGTGSISKILLNNYKNSVVHGIDISENMIKVCNKRLNKFKGRLHLFCEDIERRKTQRPPCHGRRSSQMVKKGPL